MDHPPLQEAASAPAKGQPAAAAVLAATIMACLLQHSAAMYHSATAVTCIVPPKFSSYPSSSSCCSPSQGTSFPLIVACPSLATPAAVQAASLRWQGA